MSLGKELAQERSLHEELGLGDGPWAHVPVGGGSNGGTEGRSDGERDGPRDGQLKSSEL